MDRQPTNDVLLLPTSDTSDGFRPKGTPLRGGVFVLANTPLGAGMLGLPAAFADCGYAERSTGGGRRRSAGRGSHPPPGATAPVPGYGE